MGGREGGRGEREGGIDRDSGTSLSMRTPLN